MPSLEIEGESTRMKITRIEIPSRVKEMPGDSLDSSLRNPSSRNDYSEDRTGIGTNLSEKISFGLANGVQQHLLITSCPNDLVVFLSIYVTN